MNRKVLDSSPVQHLTEGGNPNWWNKTSGGMTLPSPQMPPSTTTCHLPSLLLNLVATPTSLPSLPPNSNPNLGSWLNNSDDLPLNQLLLGGLTVGDEERVEMMNHFHQNQEKKVENWEERVFKNQAFIKQECNYNNGYVTMSVPESFLNKYCATTTIYNINNDDNNKNHNRLNLSKCDRSEIGRSSFANKKPKLEVPSLPLRPLSQSTLKVRKDKLGGRIVALHQLVSPCGKTDTASVLSEAIGYIRFLHGQIEVLSLPYFGTSTRNNMMHQHAQGDMHGIFPEDPSQLVNEYRMKISKGASSSCTSNQESNFNGEPKKDFRSRGLCLVPISCMLQADSDN